MGDKAGECDMMKHNLPHERSDETHLAVDADSHAESRALSLQNLRARQQHRRLRKILSHVVALPSHVRLVHADVPSVGYGASTAEFNFYHKNSFYLKGTKG